jgi:hypothetical protein
MEQLVKKYRELSSKNPEAKLALDLLPGTSQVTSIADAASSAYEGKPLEAAAEIAGLVPWVKGGKGVEKLRKLIAEQKLFSGAVDSSQYVDEKMRDKTDVQPKQKSIPPVLFPATKEMKKGGSVGSASKRADGCAQRGKTKGKMR